MSNINLANQHQSPQSPVGVTNLASNKTEDLHILGIEDIRCGNFAHAVEVLGQVVALRPSTPAYHVDLAEAYRHLGEPARAVGCCRAALGLRPDYPEALNTLGLALQDLGRPGEAVEAFRHALALRPDMIAALNNRGVVLQDLGRHDEAIDGFRRAAEVAPQLPRVRTNLGLALLDAGRAEEALPHLQEATRLDPDAAVLHRNLGDALRALDRPAEARAAYLEATRLDPDSAESHRLVGLTLRDESQFGGAVAWLKLAAGRDPGNPQYWEQLAELHAERDDSAEAIPCWERVLALAPPRPALAHNGLGWALQEEGRLDEARAQYRAALRLEPGLAPARLHLGGIHEQVGAMAEAEVAFRDVLRIQPHLPAAHARLATLLRDKLPEPDLAALEALLANARVPAGPRARLLFGLAHVLDGRGAYPRAAACLREANAIDLEEGKGEREYSPENHARFVDGLIAAFDAGFFRRTAGLGSRSRRPVFVLGLPRSGTTLVEQVLASHPEVHGGGELRFARQSFEDIPAVLDRAGPPIEAVPHLDAAALGRLAEEHLARLAALDGGATARIVNKMPDNTLYLGLLAALFPEATFLHCRRDLRDVAVSCWMTDFRSIRWASDPGHIASRFHEHRRVMAHWREALPVPVHVVDYEETVSDLEGVARRLLAACGLGWDPACLEFHRTERTVRTASVTQVRQPIYTRSVARWRHYERDLADLFAALPPPDGE
jgi:tetratricopeptide (TPR) repeat protein